MKRVMRFWNLNGPRSHIENGECSMSEPCIHTGEFVLSIDELRAVFQAGERHADDQRDGPSWYIWSKEMGIE